MFHRAVFPLRPTGPIRRLSARAAMLLSALPLHAASAASEGGREPASNCLALLGGELDARWGIPLAILAGALVAWGLMVVMRRLLKG